MIQAYNISLFLLADCKYGRAYASVVSVCLSVICDVSIVAKGCVLEQKLTAHRVVCEESISTIMKDLDLSLEVKTS